MNERDEIYDYIARDNSATAERLNTLFKHRTESLLDHPMSWAVPVACPAPVNCPHTAITC